MRLFLSNELLDPDRLRKLRLPIAFVTFAFMKGVMFTFDEKGYKSYQFKSFSIPAELRYSRGNNIVYGGVYQLNFADAFLLPLDGIHNCSRSIIGRNNVVDDHHRITRNIYPITFKTLEDFSRLKYLEHPPIKTHCYVGNTNQPKIKARLRETKLNYRIIQGILPDPFKKLFWEVNK